MPVSKSTIQDRRAHSRLPVFLDCDFSWGAVRHRATMMDLSISGAFISGRVAPPARTPVKIVVTTPKSKRELTLEGRVIRGGWFSKDRYAHGFGVRYEKLTPEVFMLLREVMAVSESYLRESKVTVA